MQQCLITWIDEYFILEHPQSRHLAQLPKKLMYTASHQISIAIYNRLPIIFNVIAIPDGSIADEQISIIGITETNYTHKAKVRGSLTITVNY